MPAFVTTTVLQWAVDGSKAPPTLSVVRSRQVSVIVSDAVNREDNAPFIAQYILDEVGDGKNSEELLKAARDGLLEVMETSRVPLIEPPVPIKQPS